MSLASDEFCRLEGLIYRLISTRPDWLKTWRNEAACLLARTRRAADVDEAQPRNDGPL